jgi:hypothetical protein
LRNQKCTAFLSSFLSTLRNLQVSDEMAVALPCIIIKNLQLLVFLELLVVNIEIQAEKEPGYQCCCTYVDIIILENCEKAHCRKELEQEEAQLRVKKRLCKAMPLVLRFRLELEIGQDCGVLQPEDEGEYHEETVSERACDDAYQGDGCDEDERLFRVLLRSVDHTAFKSRDVYKSLWRHPDRRE